MLPMHTLRLFLFTTTLLIGFYKQKAYALTYIPVYPVDPYYYYPYGYPPPEHLSLDEDLADFSLNGLTQICINHQKLCSEHVQHRLHKLKTLRTVGIALIVTGLTATIVGPLWTALSVRQTTDNFGNQNYTADYVPLIVGLSLGISLPITGGILMPRRSDLLETISEFNRDNPEKPIQLQFGYQIQQQRSLLKLAFQL
jgi:hypothetical protein